MSDRSRPAVGSVLRRCWPLLAAVPLGAVCGGVYALVAPAQYQANAYVMVVPETTGDNSAAVGFAQAYGRVITQPEVLLSAAATTGVPMAELTPLVQAVTSPDAPMIQITGSAATAAVSADEANAVAASLVAFGNAASKQTGVKLLTFAAAARPATPSSPSRTLDVAVGAAAGLLIGGLGVMAGRSRTGAADASVPLPRADASGGSPADAPAETGPEPVAATEAESAKVTSGTGRHTAQARR